MRQDSYNEHGSGGGRVVLRDVEGQPDTFFPCNPIYLLLFLLKADKCNYCFLNYSLDLNLHVFLFTSIVFVVVE